MTTKYRSPRLPSCLRNVHSYAHRTIVFVQLTTYMQVNSDNTSDNTVIVRMYVAKAHQNNLSIFSSHYGIASYVAIWL